MRSSIFTAFFLSVLAVACGDSSGPGGSRTPANLTVLSGDGITGGVGEAVSTPLTVRVTDNSDRAVGGVVVQFSIVQGGGNLSATQVTTNADGVASVTWTLGQTAGPARAEARVTGLAPAHFNAIVNAGEVASLLRVSTAPGSSAAGFELADSVAIRAADAFGNPVANVALTFAVTTGGGAVSHTTRTTSAQGVARVAWELGAPGAQVLQVSAGQLQTTISATATACPETAIATGSVYTIGPGDARCVVLDGPASRYLITVLNGAPAASTTNSFRLRGASTGTPQVIADEQVAPTVTPTVGLRSAAARAHIEEVRRSRDAHDKLLRANELLLRRLGPSAMARPALRRDAVAAKAPPPQVGDTLQLRIPANFDNLCSLAGAQNVRGRVVYVGNRAVVIEDVASPLADELDTLYVRMGQEFETGMWQLLNDNFGNPLAMDDVLDDNDRIFMLFSPVVNTVQGGGIAGFVAGSDFFDNGACAASNRAEIFYARVPTRLPTGPSDTYGTGTPGSWYRSTRTVVMHEVKHIVSFAERLSRQIPPLDRWIEESSAMIAEELWGRTIFGYQPESNVTYEQSIHCEVRLNETSFPECPQPYKPLNIFDHFILLYDYLSAPETLSPIGASNSSDFTFYGSGWSLLRWTMDHSPMTESAFLLAMTLGPSGGTQNLELLASRTFPELITEWSVALVTDDRPGFTPANSRHTMRSWNTRDVFAGMNRDFSNQGFFTRPHPLTPRAVSFGKFTVDVNSVRGGSMSVFEVSGTQSGQQLFEVSGLNGTNFPFDMRVNIIRVE